VLKGDLRKVAFGQVGFDLHLIKGKHKRLKKKKASIKSEVELKERNVVRGKKKPFKERWIVGKSLRIKKKAAYVLFHGTTKSTYRKQVEEGKVGEPQRTPSPNHMPRGLLPMRKKST